MIATTMMRMTRPSAESSILTSRKQRQRKICSLRKNSKRPLSPRQVLTLKMKEETTSTKGKTRGNTTGRLTLPPEVVATTIPVTQLVNDETMPTNFIRIGTAEITIIMTTTMQEVAMTIIEAVARSRTAKGLIWTRLM